MPHGFYACLKASLMLVLFVAVCGCAASPHAINQSHFTQQDRAGGETTQDPQDQYLIAGIGAYLAEKKAPPFSHYDYVREDLNGDGLREGIVLFTLPHSYWCGWGGCTMAVFTPRGDHFTLLSETKEIRGPVIALSQKTKGWKDLTVRLSGFEQADQTVVLRFDGYAYPYDPSMMGMATPYTLAHAVGTRLFP